MAVARVSPRLAAIHGAEALPRRNSGHVPVYAGGAQRWASLPRSVTPAIAKSVSAALSGMLKRGVVVRTGEDGAAFWEGAA